MGVVIYFVWPSDDTLLAMHSSLSLRKMAEKIGMNHKAIDRRIKRIHNERRFDDTLL